MPSWSKPAPWQWALLQRIWRDLNVLFSGGPFFPVLPDPRLKTLTGGWIAIAELERGDVGVGN